LSFPEPSTVFSVRVVPNTPGVAKVLIWLTLTANVMKNNSTATPKNKSARIQPIQNPHPRRRGSTITVGGGGCAGLPMGDIVSTIVYTPNQTQRWDARYPTPLVPFVGMIIGGQ
jgi:hypothetical protein